MGRPVSRAGLVWRLRAKPRKLIPAALMSGRVNDQGRWYETGFGGLAVVVRGRRRLGEGVAIIEAVGVDHGTQARGGFADGADIDAAALANQVIPAALSADRYRAPGWLRAAARKTKKLYQRPSMASRVNKRGRWYNRRCVNRSGSAPPDSNPRL
jgi:hypothetical protein